VRVGSEYDARSQMAIFTINDTGIGISSEHQEKIFEQYYQVDGAHQRNVKGTGLGLPLSRKLAELVGGSVSVQSQPGVGSRFSLRVPAHVPSLGGSLAVRTAKSPEEKPRHEIPRVLVIDDEDVARYLVRRLLATLPAEIQEARGGKEGIRFAREYAVDVIILDVSMPETSGFQVIEQLKDEPATRDIPVVVHTSLSLGPAERDALAHAKAIISKSRTEPELREVVRALVAGR
jgi:CheY-like chemotaxis protein